MSVVEAARSRDIGLSVARRAVDIAGDSLVRTEDGADHLVRLARGRCDVLEAALGALPERTSSAAALCARGLLLRALHLAGGRR